MRGFVVLGMIAAFIAGFMVAQIVSYSVEVPLSKEYTAYLLNDRNYYPEVYSILSRANRSIHMVMYEVLWYGTQNEVMKLVYLLGEKAEQGLDVKVILEYSSYSSSINENNTKVKKYLESKGAEVKFDDPHITTHCKLIIVDGKIVIIGSTNWSYSALEKNHEASVAIYDKSLADKYEGYFNYLWNQL